MRMFSWAGAFTLTAAVGVGYLICEIVHSADPLPCTLFVAAEGGELCENQPHVTIPAQVIEEIDISCTQTLPYAFAPQSNEPPLADAKAPAAVIQLASYEVPASSPDDCEFQIMPYLTDDAPPAKLPNFMDVPVIVPIPVTPSDAKPNANDPLFLMVQSFFEEAATLFDDPNQRMNAILSSDVDLHQAGADWRRIWMTDQPANLTPSGGSKEMPEELPPPGQKPDTTEVRPSDLPPKSGGDSY